jgi:hypothetical protein
MGSHNYEVELERIEKLIEAEAKEDEFLGQETPKDFGTETPVTGDDVDIVDDMLWAIMDEVVATGSSEKAAEKIVDNALDSLIDDEIIPDVPEYDSPDAVKAQWVPNARASIKHYLKLRGELL